MQYDLFGPEFKADPYPTYKALRSEQPLCRRVNADGKAIWFVTRYADVAAILRDHTRFVKNVQQTMTPAERAALPPTPELIHLLSNHMLNLDPPDHTRLRSLVSKAFTATVVNRMAERIQRMADALVDKVQARSAMDLIDDFAYPLPINVIADLLGIPLRDQGRFRQWSQAFVTPSVNVLRNTKKAQKAKRLMEDFTGYMGALFAQRRAQPQADLISALLQTEEAGDKLREEELFSMLILLIVAGHETVVDLISNGVLALLQHPDQLQLLQQQPARLDAAIEEIVRYDGPVERATVRFAAQDVAMDGHLIQRGDAVNLILAAADRDPAQFANPDQFEIDRANNRHLGFGLGVHYCLGAPLGRLEGKIAISTLFRRLPNLRLAVPLDTLRWRKVPILRGLQHMPVVWEQPAP